MSELTMTAYNEATEPFRIERLGRVGKVLRRHSIRALHDHKGVLCVDWAAEPTTQNLSAVERAWRRENEHAVNHYVRGRELVSDVGNYNPFGAAAAQEARRQT
jgi:hypothetical protein